MNYWIILYSRIYNSDYIDGYGTKIIPELPEVNINTSAASEHVAKVERCIRVIKERCRACMSTMPFKKIPNIMTINLLHFYVSWLNATPVKTILSVYSPSEIICRQKVDPKSGAN